MRVLHLVKTNVGASWAVRQVRELTRLGVDVHVALPPGGTQQAEYVTAGATVHPLQTDLPVSRPWRCPALFRDFRKLVDSVQPQLLHSHFVGTTLTMRLAMGRQHRLPRVFQVPGPLHLEHGVFRRAEIKSAGRMDFWIGSCRRTCEIYREAGIPDDRIFISYYGVDLEAFREVAPGRLRGELELPAQVPVVGMVAYLYAPKRYLGQSRGLKGHEDLIDAVGLVSQRLPDLRCVMVGGPWNGAVRYERQVREYARSRTGDRVIFMGTRGDVAQLYPDMNVVVHPSHSENVGGAVESLLSCAPTIATEVGGFPDLIRPGETGWLVPPRNPRALSDAILEVLSDPREARRRAGAGRDLTRQLFDVRETARTVLEAYERILGTDR